MVRVPEVVVICGRLLELDVKGMTASRTCVSGGSACVCVEELGAAAGQVR